MKLIKPLVLALLVLCTVLSLAACAQDQPTEPTTEPSGASSPSGSQPASQPASQPDDGKKTYTVYIQDENGDAVKVPMINICQAEMCMPHIPDASGVVTARMAEAEYKVSIPQLPEGYVLAGEQTEFYFEDGSYELTIVLKQA